MESKPLLSIIVPIYNVEDYLPRCIDSILSQTFTDFELLLVDDGSQDKSGDICDDYTQKDSRIRVIHKENGGAGSARNAGLDKSRGAYIMFVDPDDKLGTNDTIERNLNILQRCDRNCFVQFPTLWNYKSERNKMVKQGKKILSGENAILKSFFNLQITSVVWDKIYDRKIFSTIRFPDMRYYEDFYCIINILKNTDSVIFSDTGFYDYCIREGSATTSNLSAKKLIDFLCVRMFALNEARKLDSTGLYRVHFFLEMQDILVYGRMLIDNFTLESYCTRIYKFIPDYKAIFYYMTKRNLKKGLKCMAFKIIGEKNFCRWNKIKK